MMRAWAYSLLAVLVTWWSHTAAIVADEPDGQRFFREKIEPVLVAHCYECHSRKAQELQASLRLDARETLLRGGDSGPAVIAGKSADSLLIQAIRHQGGLEMPPEKPQLPEQVIADFARWVDMGAPAPSSDASAVAIDTVSPAARRHWSFQPLPGSKPAPPSVEQQEWVNNPVDAFVLAGLELRRWRPADPARRAEWLRRVTLDLTGLPPLPEEIRDFNEDARPDAKERVVERLLASPRYGERWAQHWLDVVRYAETEGYEYDRHLPDAWRFRDYVIDSLNRDKPFDQFLVEQIAGDELDGGNREYLAASIFHRLGPVRRNAGNPEIALRPQ
jgi:hypothetical protein